MHAMMGEIGQFAKPAACTFISKYIHVLNSPSRRSVLEKGAIVHVMFYTINGSLPSKNFDRGEGPAANGIGMNVDVMMMRDAPQPAPSALSHRRHLLKAGWQL